MSPRRSRTLQLLAGLAALAWTAPILADDLIPPPWPRFSPGSTVQAWDFSAGSGGGAPDALPFSNPYGTPFLTVTDPANFLPTWNGRNDVWAVNDLDFLRFDIPNDGPNLSAIKDVWLQITYNNQPPVVGGVSLTSTLGPAMLIGTPTITPLANGWTHEASLWRFNGCPSSETLILTPPVFGTVLWVDQVVIDTSCYVPEPTSAALGVLAGVGILRRRRR